MPNDESMPGTQKADPQSYGLARWLSSQPLFKDEEVDNPQRSFMSPGFKMRDAVRSASSGEDRSFTSPEHSEGGDDPSSGGPGGEGDIQGILDSFFGGKAPSGRVNTNYAGQAGTIGSVAQSVLGLSPGIGMVASLAGRGVDLSKANDDLTKMGASHLGIGDYLSSVLNGMTFGLAGTSINDAYTGKLGDWARNAEASMSQNGILDRLNADNYLDYGQSPFGKNNTIESFLDSLMNGGAGPGGTASESSYVDSLGRSWSGPDGSGAGATGGTADDEGGGWSGGSSDSDIGSGGDW